MEDFLLCLLDPDVIIDKNDEIGKVNNHTTFDNNNKQ